MQSSLKPSRWSLARRESLWAYAFIAPWTIGFIIFTLGPMLASLFFSFTEYDIVSPPKWIGLTNYINLIHDPLFWHSMGIFYLPFYVLNLRHFEPLLLIPFLSNHK